jgi:hypothetical protein
MLFSQCKNGKKYLERLLMLYKKMVVLAIITVAELVCIIVSAMMNMYACFEYQSGIVLQLISNYLSVLCCTWNGQP